MYHDIGGTNRPRMGVTHHIASSRIVKPAEYEVQYLHVCVTQMQTTWRKFDGIE